MENSAASLSWTVAGCADEDIAAFITIRRGEVIGQVITRGQSGA